MSNYSRKFKQSLFFSLYLLFSVCAMMFLVGCSGSDDIPPASVLTSGRVTLTWEDVLGAAAYNIYFSMSPGVTDLNSYKYSNVTNPFTIVDLEPGTTYYFVVTIEDALGQSRKSKELSYIALSDAEGSLDFGDIVDQSALEAAVSKLKDEPAVALSASEPAVTPEPKDKKVASTHSNKEIIICFGDSLTFGTGAGKGMDYPSQLAKMLRKPVINKGIPGDTTASALRRLDSDVLSMRPDIVLITLGGNDFKNGVSKDIAFNNLKRIVQTIQKQGAKVIIGGLRLPGMDREFGKGYEDLAQQTGAILIPDIYADILDDPKLMSDPIHPSNSGYRIIARRFNQAIASVGLTVMPATNPTTAKAHQVTLAWDEVPNATSYNIYWSDMPGVTKKNGTKISDVKNPHKITGLKKGKVYYFVVTAVNASGESKESKELSFTVGQ